jgi:hypothetical protein
MRAGVARYAFTVTDLHRLPSPGLPAHPSAASIGDILLLFDYLVCTREQRLRDGETECLRGRQIDDEFELSLPFDREILWLRNALPAS